MLGTTVVLYAAREEIRDFVREHPSETLDDLTEAGHTQGTGAIAPALALGAWLASFAGNHVERRETAQMFLESAGFAAVGAAAGSYVLAAERPEEGEAIYLFDVEGHGVSLDVALAASIVPPLQCRWLRVLPDDGPWRRTWKRSLTGLVYTGVALTAYQRMYTDKHWAPDVFLGTFTGLGAGNAVCAAHADTNLGAREEVSIA